MSDRMTSPLWCANDEPHAPHSRRNDFNGTDYCTGRPSPLPTDSDELAREISGYRYGSEVARDEDRYLAEHLIAKGYRRSVVSTPSDETIKSALYRGLGGLVGSYVPSHIADRAVAEIRTAVSAPPTITDEMADTAEEERGSHRYTLVAGTDPIQATCTCGWVGVYAGEWRRHRERAALVAALGGEENLISEEMVERFRQAWEQANAEGDVGNRVRRGLHAALRGGS